MLTDQDIKKLEQILATKKDFIGLDNRISGLEKFTEDGFAKTEERISGLEMYVRKEFTDIKQEISSLKETIQGLAVAIDSLAKTIDDLRLEYVAIKNQLARHEEWIKKIAEKSGVKLEY